MIANTTVTVVYDAASLDDQPTDDEMDEDIRAMSVDIETWPGRRAAIYAAQVGALSYGSGGW